ncbi:hypothetical protein ACIB24_20340 [Spongisporangium articulatum]|uniref:Cell division protein FtsL n=1 Tax=Spongisporangium articulatum TaxID=3362603 RepID=A0ABW8ASP4_9ACTN
MSGVSGAAAARLPQRAPRPVARQRAQQAPRLRVVAPRLGTSRAKLAWLCVGMLCTGLVALLMLTISLGSGAYTLTQLQRQQRDLSEQRQALTEQVQAMRAPAALAERAGELGMVPAPNAAFLQLPSGRIQGESAAATAPPKPAPKPPTTTKKTDAAKSDAKKSDAKTSDAKTGAKTDAKKTDSRTSTSKTDSKTGDTSGGSGR